jgi:hypothetical protein
MPGSHALSGDGKWSGLWKVGSKANGRVGSSPSAATSRKVFVRSPPGTGAEVNDMTEDDLGIVLSEDRRRIE